MVSKKASASTRRKILDQDSDLISQSEHQLLELESFTEPRFPNDAPSRHLKAAQASLLQSLDAQQSAQPLQAIPKAKQGDQQRLSVDEVSALLQIKDELTDQSEDPYTELEKWRQHDAYRRDGAARRAINVLADFVLGDRTKNTIDINGQDFATKQEEDIAIKSMQDNAKYRDVKSQLDKIDRRVNFDQWSTAAFIQCKVFGRAVLVIEDDPETNLPIALKILSSMRLGRVFINQRTWEIEAIEYLDYSGLQSIIPKDKMIYFTNLNIGFSPNTYGFGLSDFETIMDLCDTNRIIRERDQKEINRSLWAAYLIIKVNTRKRKVMQQIAKNLKPGVPFVHNLDITDVQVHTIAHDLEKILAEAEQNDRKIARDLAVLSYLMGFEDFPNRAVASTTLDSWTRSILAKIRTWLRGIIEPQWNDRNAARILGIPKEQMIDQEVKFKRDFNTIVVDDLLNDSTATSTLVNANIIDTQKAREVLGMDDIDERMQAEDIKRDALEQQTLMVQEKQLKQGILPGQSQQQTTGGAFGRPSTAANPALAKVLKDRPVRHPRKPIPPQDIQGVAAASSLSEVDLKKLEVLEAIKKKIEQMV